MKIPARLIICDTEWRVVFKKRIGRDVLGMCDPAKHEIILLKGLNENDLVSTLIHEVLHAIEFGLGKTIGHALIYKVETPLASVLKQVFAAQKGE